MQREKIVVIGAGAFGTALAVVIALENRHDVILLGRDPSLMADLRSDRVHEAMLPGVELPDVLEFSAEPDVLTSAGIVLFAMPSQAHADAARHYGPYLANDSIVVTCAKGIDRSSGRLLTELLEAELPVIRSRFSPVRASRPILREVYRRPWRLRRKMQQ